MSEKYSTIQQAQSSGQEEDLEREPSLLRLLRKSGEHGLIDGELRQELERLFELLYRIDRLIDRVEQSPAGDEIAPHQVVADDDASIDQRPSPPRESDESLEANGGIQIGGHILAFDPAEFARPPMVASPVRRPEKNPATTPPERTALRQPGQYQTFKEAGDDQLERWWVNFNGVVSLERLARLRHVLAESPFTFEARFDEITDGLIILRIVTDRKLTRAHVDWIVRQVMASVGLNRDTAILSSHKENPGGN